MEPVPNHNPMSNPNFNSNHSLTDKARQRCAIWFTRFWTSSRCLLAATLANYEQTVAVFAARIDLFCAKGIYLCCVATMSI